VWQENRAVGFLSVVKKGNIQDFKRSFRKKTTTFISEEESFLVLSQHVKYTERTKTSSDYTQLANK